ncbi:hypothetical protein DKG77_14480 [Flagellimonas aquimarina]|jgi:hypothetical protein|uniref:Uncharacterized protein n=1 Tax=Flagellimonas aquimarina TaxID=2201895 RepID=A0A316KUT8_9FLAO|nr:DUF6768 family protein [Allomuricauda koreensis]PWL37514.1 hypothetical protein DKG77_14480 [Allomuricauda koreensis]
MKKDIEKIDELIKEALTQEEAKFYDDLGEQNIIEKLGSVFKGKTGWLAIIMNLFNLIIFGLLIFCVVQFLNTEITNELIKWGTGIFACLIFMGMIKLFVWMQMDKNDILRELKRLELQISTLSHKKND